MNDLGGDAESRGGVLTAATAAAIANILLGAGVVATRVATRESDVYTLAVLRFALVSACMLPLLWFRRPALDNGDGWRIVIFGLSLFGVLPILSNIGVAGTLAWHAGLMISTVPVWTMLFSHAVGAEPVGSKKMAGVALTVVGVAVTLVPPFGVGGDPLEFLPWDILILFVAMANAGSNVFARPLVRRYGAKTVSTVGMPAGSVLLVFAALTLGEPSRALDYSAQTWGAAAFLALLVGPLPFFVFLWALARLTPTQATIFLNLVPLTAGLLGGLLLGEPLGWQFCMGAVCVIVGVLTTVGGGAPRVPAPRNAIEVSSQLE